MPLSRATLRRWACPAFALAPAAALAHGQEVVFLPYGNIIALVAVVIVASVVRTNWPSRAMAIVLGIAGVIVAWLAPAVVDPYGPRLDELGFFLLGLLPPLGLPVLFLVWSGRRRARADRPAGEPKRR